MIRVLVTANLDHWYPWVSDLERQRSCLSWRGRRNADIRPSPPSWAGWIKISVCASFQVLRVRLRISAAPKESIALHFTRDQAQNTYV